MVRCLHTSKLQAAASALLMGESRVVYSLPGSPACTGFEGLLRLWVQKCYQPPAVSVWAYAFRNAVLEQSPCKVRGIWGFVRLQLCLVSDVEAALQLGCITMRPQGTVSSNKASWWRRDVQGWFCFSCVFHLFVKGKKASGNLMSTLFVFVNTVEF